MDGKRLRYFSSFISLISLKSWKILIFPGCAETLQTLFIISPFSFYLKIIKYVTIWRPLFFWQEPTSMFCSDRIYPGEYFPLRSFRYDLSRLTSKLPLHVDELVDHQRLSHRQPGQRSIMLPPLQHTERQDGRPQHTSTLWYS